MKFITFRSVHISQRVLLSSVMVLAAMAIYLGYSHYILHNSQKRYQNVLRIQKTFGDILGKENAVLSGKAHPAELLSANQQLIGAVEDESWALFPGRFRERQLIFEKLQGTVLENTKSFSRIRGSLPDLVKSVRYIHEHHVVNLKNLLRRGESVQDYDIGPDFKRSTTRSAPELDIIDAGIAVQSRLLDVMSVFYEMQLGQNKGDLELLFTERMDLFYEAVNQFDDYTLDAQDGLLVEELLLTGRQFTTAFAQLLKNEQSADRLRTQLVTNQRQIDEEFEEVLRQLKSTSAVLRQQLTVVQNTTAVVAALLACWLVYYGVVLSREFSRTVTETEKIQKDFKYRISCDQSHYLEFEVIHDTLNLLAKTADEQVQALEKMQGDLSCRVQERTAELVHMNNRLRNEIQERKEADSSRRELEEKLIRAKKMEAIGTLAGGVAHDLNNILSGVVSYPELLLLDMDQQDPLYSSILTIKESGEKAASIVQDLLTLARRGVAISEVIDIRQLLTEYLGSPEFRSLQDSHPEITVQCDFKEQTGNVKGSRLHILKTVMNLVANGMEAMVGGGALTLKCDSVYIDTALKGYDTVKEGEYVRLVVQDTGVGMSGEVTEQIFEPFFTQKTMGRSGTGLGMAVVYSTIKDHGGYIDIHSVPGEGSVISVYLPLTRESQVKEGAGVQLETLMGNSEQILVVDDVFDQRKIATRMLQRLNYVVTTAASGEEAVEFIKENEVDLIILDMIMPPGMDGLDTFMAIKAERIDAKVVIASGFSESDRVRRAQDLGAGSYIKKPYSMETLGLAVKEVLQHSGGNDIL